nr:MAG TPA_asm: hypothetical protein [Caudoviricetes sp.]
MKVFCQKTIFVYIISQCNVTITLPVTQCNAIE